MARFEPKVSPDTPNSMINSYSAREITALWTLCVLCGAYLRLWHVKS